MSGCGVLLSRVRPSARPRTPQRALYAVLSAVGALWSVFGAYHWGGLPVRLSAPGRVLSGVMRFLAATRYGS